MPRSPHPRQTALTLISAAMLGLALVLGLWQQIDRACAEGDGEPGEPLATCEPVPLADVEQAPPRTSEDVRGVSRTAD